jgi:hypothetical protein
MVGCKTARSGRGAAVGVQVAHLRDQISTQTRLRLLVVGRSIPDRLRGNTIDAACAASVTSAKARENGWPGISVRGRVILRAATMIHRHFRNLGIGWARIREQHVAGSRVVQVSDPIASGSASHPFGQHFAHPGGWPDTIVAARDQQYRTCTLLDRNRCGVCDLDIVQTGFHHRQPGNSPV